MDAGPIRQYAAHIEQVVDLPDGAEVTMANADCPVGGYVIGSHVFTTQYHPEMTHGFIGALIDELADQKPAEVIDTARASLTQSAENGRFGRWIVAFLRGA
jgi:GMP synthase-like glutamine amidotransferase